MSDAKFSKRIQPQVGLLHLLDTLMDWVESGQAPAGRADAMSDRVLDAIVDTVLPLDTETWETGIKRDGRWSIVEQYPDAASAKQGHQRWVAALSATPNMELPDMDVWSIGELDE